MFTFRINIALHNPMTKRAEHYARVNLESGILEAEALAQFKDIAHRFPASEGFSLTLHRVPAEMSDTIAYSEGA